MNLSTNREFNLIFIFILIFITLKEWEREREREREREIELVFYQTNCKCLLRKILCVFYEIIQIKYCISIEYKYLSWKYNLKI